MSPNSVIQKLREVFKHSLIYGLTSSLQSILGFALLPILTNYYETETFGIYSILLLMSAVANSLFYLGASSALGRFYYEEDSEEYRKKIISTTLLIALVGGLVLVGISIFAGTTLSTWLFDSRDYALAIIIAMSGTAAGFLLNLMTLILRYNKKSMVFMITIVSGVLLNFFVTYLLLTEYDFGLMAPLYGLLVSNSLSFFVLLCLHTKYLTIRLEKRHMSMAISFGLQSSMIGFLFYVMDWVDRMIIKDVLDLSEVGIYSLGYRLGSVIQILVIVPFSLVWAPTRMQYWKDNNAGTMTTKVVSYYSIVGFAMVFMAMLVGEEILSLFFTNKEYSGAMPLFPIIMFSLLLYGYQNILDFGIYLNKKLYIYILIYITGIGLNIGLNYIFIPRFGYMAAAFTTLATYTFTVIAIYFISNRYYKIKLESKRLFIPLFVILISYLFVHNSGYFDQGGLYKKVALSAIVLFLFFRFWLTPTEKARLRKVIAPK